MSVIANLVGKLAGLYARKMPEHRGKFRALNILDRCLGPFRLNVPASGITLRVFLSSPMDVYYISTAAENDADIPLDKVTLRLIEALNPGDIFIDIGANIGYFAIQAAKRVGPRGLVVAVEPSNREYMRLLQNICDNDVCNIITVHAALGKSNGSARLAVHPHHTGLNKVEADVNIGGLPVALFRGSQVLTSLLAGRYPRIVKIDVEGGELDVLDGMRDLLALQRPESVVVEITPKFLAHLGHCKADIYAIMQALGYEPTVNLNAEQYDEVFVYRR